MDIKEFQTPTFLQDNKEFDPSSIDTDKVLKELEEQDNINEEEAANGRTKDCIKHENGVETPKITGVDANKTETDKSTTETKILPVVEGLPNKEDNEIEQAAANVVESETYETGESSIEDELGIGDESLKEIAAEIKEKVMPFTPIDTSSLSFGNPINITNTIDPNDILQEEVWPLLSEDRLLKIKELRGAALNNIITIDDRVASYNELMSKYGKIYKSIVSAKEPTVKAWIDNVDYTSYQDLNFAIYAASFKNANHMAMQCEECKHNFLYKDIPMNKMYRFKDGKAKERFESIMRSGNTDPKKDVWMKQVSDRYFIGIKIPSIYKFYIERKLLKPEFNDKFDELITICTYIESIQFIEKQEDGTCKLRPIQITDNADAPAKSYMDRLKKFIMVLDQLTSDQFVYLVSLIRQLENEHIENGIEYLLPEATCPKCGKTSKAEVVYASQLLFTRHQLQALANSVQ